MHSSASELGQNFFEFYWKPEFKRILDIGSLNVNGTLREYCPQGAEYIGIDVESGAGVDFVLDDPYRYPFADGYFDLIVTTSYFQRDPMFWMTFLEASRVLSPKGFLYINAPSNGWYQACPWDHWRFYPDASLALEHWGRRSGAATWMVESFTSGRAPGEFWNDYVMIFGGAQSEPQQLISDVRLNFYNVRQNKRADIINLSTYNEDMKIINEYRNRVNSQFNISSAQVSLSKSKKLTIFCVAYKRYESIYVLTHSLMSQTVQNFDLVLIHDGPDERMSAIFDQLKARYPDRLHCYFTDQRFNDYGHTLRDIAIGMCSTEFIMLTNDDNYYTPRFIEYMFERIDQENLDLVLCDMIHSHNFPGGRPQENYNVFVTEPVKNSVDIGCFIVRTSVAKSVGFRDKNAEGDGTFVDDFMNKFGKDLKWGKVHKVLFVHN